MTAKKEKITTIPDEKTDSGEVKEVKTTPKTSTTCKIQYTAQARRHKCGQIEIVSREKAFEYSNAGVAIIL